MSTLTPTPIQVDAAFTETLKIYQQRVDAALLLHLPDPKISGTRLPSAMRYSVTNGGKRIRPILTYATGKALGLSLDRVDVAACSLEMMHAYSLVHDDLPAMDDDDLRRGKPTCHKAFDEATAILAGDALQALAFTILALNRDPLVSATAKLRMVEILGQASGAHGMAAGQAIDLESVGRKLTLAELENMHNHKTGALIKASVLLPAMLADPETSELQTRLENYAGAVGLCFQIVDDILDVVSDTETLGKKQGADIALNKPTYPALLGLEGAREHAQNMHQTALSQLDGLGPDFDELRMLSAYIVQRNF
ncbi:(2E,6E)-farnesyl diphosphate synthase [Granulosicoccus antarcticus]|uniref:Farnesyl diphosphate synthase n=1 Tax=Granulosicoccus antarcticus IMCC3135 TaxID=1192854 RepID=A0A2Z2P1I5_9GAMM|nr:farnesyl diphosphate synthase [Granulosicoccus antarcticus]ASJ76068.1 Farnesyl diphosphate synthase [Granulosicoccus antarcticus IMCC3135]